MDKTKFLHQKVATHDPILLTITSSPGPQLLKGKIEKVYSHRHGIEEIRIGREIEFVSSPRTWGNSTLKVGEKAIVFVKSISGKIYEDTWHGHMLIENIDDTEYAIFPHRELWLDQNIPCIIRKFSKQDPQRPYASAIEFEAIANYLRSIISKINLQEEK